jgi:outer membrane protein assembly factor BamB
LKFRSYPPSEEKTGPKFKPPFRLKWATRLEGQMKATPAVGGGRVYAQTVNGLITTMDLETGRILWRNYYPGVLPDNPAQNRASPLFAEGRLYFAYYPGGFYCVDAATGSERWNDPDGVRLAGRFSALAHGGLIFYPYWVRSADKKTRYVIFKALDAATGKEAWRKEYPGFSSPNSVLAPAPAVSPGCIGDGIL